MFGLVFFTDTEDNEVDSHICSHSMEAETLLPPGVLQPDQLALFLRAFNQVVLHLLHSSMSLKEAKRICSWFLIWIWMILIIFTNQNEAACQKSALYLVWKGKISKLSNKRPPRKLGGHVSDS